MAVEGGVPPRALLIEGSGNSRKIFISQENFYIFGNPIGFFWNFKIVCGVFFQLEIKQVIVAGSVGTMFFWVEVV